MSSGHTSSKLKAAVKPLMAKILRRYDHTCIDEQEKLLPKIRKDHKIYLYPQDWER